MKLKQYINEQDQLEMQLAEPNSPLAQAFNGEEKLIKKYGNIERYKGQFGSFRYIYRDKGTIIAAVQGVLKPPIISNIFVSDKYRRKGIASKLFNQASKDIKGLKISSDKTELGKKFFKESVNELKWEDITKNIKIEEPIYKGVHIIKEPQAKNFPIQQIKKVLDNVPIGKTVEIRILNTPWVKGREYGMWIKKQNLILISQKGATKKTINYALAHELGHANGYASEKDAHTFALNHGYQKKFNV